MTQVVEYRDQIVRLADLTVTADMVTEKSFVNCIITGPAVITLLGAVRIEHTAFDTGSAELEAMLIEVAPDRTLTGVVAVKACSFEYCRFERVAFIGSAEMLDTLRAGIGGN